LKAERENAYFSIGISRKKLECDGSLEPLLRVVVPVVTITTCLLPKHSFSDLPRARNLPRNALDRVKKNFPAKTSRKTPFGT
jgi:hypothetical protein